MTMSELNAACRSRFEELQAAYKEEADYLENNIADYVGYPDDLLEVANKLFAIKAQMDECEKIIHAAGGTPVK